MKADLEFIDFIKKLKGNLGKTDWITIFSNSPEIENSEQGAYFCALISNDKVNTVLENYSWELHIGDGCPGFSSYFEDGKEIMEYHRFWMDGIEPFVYRRTFHGLKPDYLEVSEEFRLCFNLFEQRNSDDTVALLHVDDNGDDVEVVKILKNEVKVRLKFIKEYLSVRNMCLVVYFDFMRFSEEKPSVLVLSKKDDIETQIEENDIRARLVVRDMNFSKNNFQGWIMGKKIICGLPNFKPGIFWPSENKEIFEKFIIGVDENGKEIISICDEEKLNNYFGKNKKSPHYLTPVFFKKEVLKKYYDNPEKYNVQDGNITCGGLWSLRLDNNHSEYVVVFLGDLGHLVYKEQVYWKSFNVAHQGGISQTMWKRGFMAEFANPEQPDLYFKYRYEEFQREWFKKFGWYLFKPLSEKDGHHYKSLHLPVSENQKEFDEQILSIVKIIIDSINEKEIVRVICFDEGMKSISKLEKFIFKKAGNFKEMFEFLRNLQLLRSVSIAHRKSEKNKDYKKACEFFGIGKKKLPDVFADILIKTIWVLNTIESKFLKSEENK